MQNATSLATIAALGLIAFCLIVTLRTALHRYRALHRELHAARTGGLITVSFQNPPREEPAIADRRPVAHRPRRRHTDSRIAAHRLHKFGPEPRRA